MFDKQNLLKMVIIIIIIIIIISYILKYFHNVRELAVIVHELAMYKNLRS